MPQNFHLGEGVFIDFFFEVLSLNVPPCDFSPPDLILSSGAPSHLSTPHPHLETLLLSLLLLTLKMSAAGWPVSTQVQTGFLKLDTGFG